MSRIATECELVQYADDSQFIFTGSPYNIKAIIEKAERTLKIAKQYFDINGLKVNPDKTQAIFLGSRQHLSKVPSNLKINFDGTLIELSNTVNNLGVVLDKYMTFESHVNTVYRKTMGTLMYINHIKNNIDKETRLMLIQSLALTMINYCFKIWGGTSKTQIQRVQKLQNFAAKLAVGNARKYDHATPSIKELNWLKMQEKYQYELSIFMYKRVKGLIPKTLINLTPVESISQVTTRQSNNNNFYVARSKTNMGSRELAKCCPKVWNGLPKEVKEAGTIALFKRKLVNYLLTK